MLKSLMNVFLRKWTMFALLNKSYLVLMITDSLKGNFIFW